ncbi:MAG: ribosomal protein S18-alanine N-acetyltransferase [Gammaproteobacteria bacterium]
MSAVIKPVEYQIRPMVEADLPEVMYVEERCYEFPWTLGIFQDCLRVGYPCWTLVGGERIEGYGVMMVGAGEAHILNICVRQESRGRGHGRAILDHLMAEARLHHAHSAYLEVRPTNAEAIALYRHAGFSEVGYRRNYYPAATGREDALILAFTLPSREG